MTDKACSSMMTLDGIRSAADLWNLDPDVLHLNHGSFGAVPIAIQQLQGALRAEMEANPVRWFANLPQRVAAARQEIADLLGVPASMLAFAPNASAAVTSVLNTLDAYFRTSPGRLRLSAVPEVIVTNHGYGAVTMGAQRLAEQLGGICKTVDVPLEATEDEAFDAIVEQITDMTCLVVIDQITSSTARALPASRVAEYASSRGIFTIIDGAHVPGLQNEWIFPQPNTYWIGNLHKFACSPRGAAILLSHPESPVQPRPLVDSWGAHDPYPHSFDIQGTLDVTSYLAAPAAFSHLEETLGWGRIHQHMELLGDYASARVTEALGRDGERYKVNRGQPVRGMELIRLPGGLIWDHASADAVRDRFVNETSAEAAFTEFKGAGYLRLSFHAYNTMSNIDDFATQYIPLLREWAQ